MTKEEKNIKRKLEQNIYSYHADYHVYLDKLREIINNKDGLYYFCLFCTHQKRNYL